MLGQHKKAPPISQRGLIITRRRPTLPPLPGGSTIGAVGLDCRVRNENGYDPHAIAAEKIFRFEIFPWRTFLGPTGSFAAVRSGDPTAR